MVSRKIVMVAKKFPIDIYLKNLEMLCSLAKLTHQEFNELLEKRNAFRRETESISNDVLNKLTRCFVGVSREWLMSKNNDAKNIRFNPPEDVINKFYPGMKHLLLNNGRPGETDALVKAAEAFCTVLAEEGEKTKAKKEVVGGQ